MKSGVIIQARINSERLPGKILMPLNGEPILFRVIERCQEIENIDKIVIAIPDTKQNEVIEKNINEWKFKVKKPLKLFKGDEKNVLSRTYNAAIENDLTTIMRITSDCPFIDPKVSSSLLNIYKRNNAEYARLDSFQGFPIGFETEIFETLSLSKLMKLPLSKSYLEHVTPYFWKNPDKFNSIILSSTPNLRHIRLVVDTPEDLEMSQIAYKYLKKEKGLFDYKDIKNLLAKKPEIFKINQKIKQKSLIGVKC
jgi:spore coat polysaccharide biosynthesis protein SpsF